MTTAVPARSHSSGLGTRFIERFGRAPEWIIRAPGRVNLIGEHTDHNGGFVLPMAIQHATLIAAAPGEARSSRIRAYSANLDDHGEFSVSGGNLQSVGDWTDYIRGVLAEFLSRGSPKQSLDLLIESDIPMGCGLSSSAALQVATASLLQQVYPGLVDDDAVAALCQEAEHKFTGVPVGIMDQFCVANAREDHLLFLDCRSLETVHVPFDGTEVAVLIVDSKVSRRLRSGAYAKRRTQCTQACDILGVTELRDANESSVEAARESLGDLLFRRALHVTSENRRTGEAVAAVQDRNWGEFGRLMYASHHSMAEDFEMSCRELDILVRLARNIGRSGGVYGARMTGGGFGGCMVALIDKARSETIVDNLQSGYRKATSIELTAYVSSPGDGARALSPTAPEFL